MNVGKDSLHRSSQSSKVLTDSFNQLNTNSTLIYPHITTESNKNSDFVKPLETCEYVMQSRTPSFLCGKSKVYEYLGRKLYKSVSKKRESQRASFVTSSEYFTEIDSESDIIPLPPKEYEVFQASNLTPLESSQHYDLRTASTLDQDAELKSNLSRYDSVGSFKSKILRNKSFVLTDRQGIKRNSALKSEIDSWRPSETSNAFLQVIKSGTKSSSPSYAEALSKITADVLQSLYSQISKIDSNLPKDKSACCQHVCRSTMTMDQILPINEKAISSSTYREKEPINKEISLKSLSDALEESLNMYPRMSSCPHHHDVVSNVEILNILKKLLDEIKRISTLNENQLALSKSSNFKPTSNRKDSVNGAYDVRSDMQVKPSTKIDSQLDIKPLDKSRFSNEIHESHKSNESHLLTEIRPGSVGNWRSSSDNNDDFLHGTNIVGNNLTNSHSPNFVTNYVNVEDEISNIKVSVDNVVPYSHSIHSNALVKDNSQMGNTFKEAGNRSLSFVPNLTKDNESLSYQYSLTEIPLSIIFNHLEERISELSSTNIKQETNYPAKVEDNVSGTDIDRLTSKDGYISDFIKSPDYLQSPEQYVNPTLKVPASIYYSPDINYPSRRSERNLYPNYYQKFEDRKVEFYQQDGKFVNHPSGRESAPTKNRHRLKETSGHTSASYSYPFIQTNSKDTIISKEPSTLLYSESRPFKMHTYNDTKTSLIAKEPHTINNYSHPYYQNRCKNIKSCISTNELNSLKPICTCRCPVHVDKMMIGQDDDEYFGFYKRNSCPKPLNDNDDTDEQLNELCRKYLNKRYPVNHFSCQLSEPKIINQVTHQIPVISSNNSKVCEATDSPQRGLQTDTQVITNMQYQSPRFQKSYINCCTNHDRENTMKFNFCKSNRSSWKDLSRLCTINENSETHHPHFRCYNNNVSRQEMSSITPEIPQINHCKFIENDMINKPHVPSPHHFTDTSPRKSDKYLHNTMRSYIPKIPNHNTTIDMSSLNSFNNCLVDPKVNCETQTASRKTNSLDEGIYLQIIPRVFQKPCENFYTEQESNNHLIPLNTMKDSTVVWSESGSTRKFRNECQNVIHENIPSSSYIQSRPVVENITHFKTSSKDSSFMFSEDCDDGDYSIPKIHPLSCVKTVNKECDQKTIPSVCETEAVKAAVKNNGFETPNPFEDKIARLEKSFLNKATQFSSPKSQSNEGSAKDKTFQNEFSSLRINNLEKKFLGVRDLQRKELLNRDLHVKLANEVSYEANDFPHNYNEADKFDEFTHPKLQEIHGTSLFPLNKVSMRSRGVQYSRRIKSVNNISKNSNLNKSADKDNMIPRERSLFPNSSTLFDKTRTSSVEKSSSVQPIFNKTLTLKSNATKAATSSRCSFNEDAGQKRNTFSMGTQTLTVSVCSIPDSDFSYCSEMVTSSCDDRCCLVVDRQYRCCD